jgi:hypothetical protein
LESLENNINQSFDNTHKFSTLSRHLNSGGGERALSGDESLLVAKYILETTVTDFQYDRTDTPIPGNGIQVSATCSVHLSGSAEFKKPNGSKINANFEVATNAAVAMNPKNIALKNMGDELLRAAAHEAANQIVSQVSPK